MMNYGQFCPIAKAAEIIGEKWSLLIIREILMGGSRFNELQRGLSLISPTILTKRLNTLAEQGMVVKKKIKGQQGYEYLPTDACQELMPIIKSLGDWGMRWARKYIVDTDYDVELLMLYLERSVQTDKLIGDEMVIRFKFTDIKEPQDWWLIATNDQVDVCNKDPGKEVDVYYTCSVKTMVDIWMGDLSYKKALSSNLLTAVGHKTLANSISSWMTKSVFSDLPAPNQI